MSYEDGRNRGDNGHTALERRALDALRGLPRPAPSDEARQRTLAVFLSGAAPGADAGADRPVAPSGRLPIRSVERWRQWALAATIVLVTLAGFWYGGQPRYDWVVTDVIAPEGVAAADPTAKGLSITSGRITTGPDSELELQLGDQLRFRMLPGSSIDLPSAPRRWLPRAQVIAVQSGEIYGTTGGQVLAVPLRIAAAEAEARLMGTTFAVFQNELGTCICLWQGCITVFPRAGGPSVRMEDESKFYVYPNGSNSGMVPLDDMERMKLSMMAEGGIIEVLPVE